METPPVNSYVDLQIIDCNRRHSVQARSGNNTNPALFTNELGEGIQLEVGDRVSVQGAYISELQRQYHIQKKVRNIKLKLTNRE